MWTLPTQGDFCRASYCFVLPRFLREQRGVTEYIASGIIQYTSIVYSNWSGRWAGVGIETLLLSKTPQPFAYPWLILTLLATQFLILYFAVHEFIAGFRGALYLSAVIASVYWAVMPSATQGIFWILGIVESQLPLTLVLLLFAFVLSRRPTDTNPSNILVTIAAAVLGFLTPAFHELAGGILLLALSIITVAAFVSKSSLRMLWLIVWTASALGFLVVFVAPGNAIRMAATANRGNYATVIRGTLSTARHYILPWFLDLQALAIGSLALARSSSRISSTKTLGLEFARGDCRISYCLDFVSDGCDRSGDLEYGGSTSGKNHEHDLRYVSNGMDSRGFSGEATTSTFSISSRSPHGDAVNSLVTAFGASDHQRQYRAEH